MADIKKAKASVPRSKKPAVPVDRALHQEVLATPPRAKKRGRRPKAEIARRSKAEEELRRSEELFRKAVQSTTDIVWEWDIGSGRVQWYGDIDSMLGYPAGEFPRTLDAWENALYRDDRERVMAALNRHAETGEPYNVEYRIIRKDGSMRNWIDRGLVILDDEGRITRSVGACVDITEHRQSEARARIRRDLTFKLAGHIDMQTALQHCLDAAIEISGFDLGVIYVLDEKSGDLKAACHFGLSPFLLQNYVVLKSDSPDAKLIKKGQPFYVKGEEFTPPFDEQLKAEGFTFDAMIPVKYKGAVIASLGIFSHIQDSMPTVIRDSLEAIAADIGVIIDRISSRQALKASEERYRFITDHTADIIWVLDKNLRYTYISPSVTRLRGFSVEEAMSHDVTEQMTPASLEELAQAIVTGSIAPMNSTANPAQWFTRELEMFRKDGSTVWMETSVTAITDEKGRFSGLLGISRDISNRRQAEQSLRESEEKYRLVVENAREAIIVAQDGLLKFANQNTADITGYSKDELSLMRFTNLIHPEDRQMVIDRYLRRLKGEVFENTYPFRVVTKDGREIWVEIQAVKIEWEGKPATLNFLSDITIRKQMENQIVQSEAKYRSIVDTSAAGIAIADEAGALILVNDRLCGMFGYIQDEVLGRQFLDFVHPEERHRIANDFFEAVASSKTLPALEFRGVRKDGSTIWLLTTPNPLKVGDHLNGFSVVIQDITQLKQAETALKESEQRYRSLFQHNPAMVYALDRQGHYTSVNAAALQITGYREEDVGKMGFADVMAPEHLETVKRNYARALHGEPQSYDSAMIAKDGRRIDIHITSTPIIIDGEIIGVYGIAEDITGRKQMEQQLNNSRQMLKLVLDTIPQRVFWKDADFKYLGCNLPFAGDAGFTDTEAIIGKDDFELVWKEYAQLYRDDDKLIMETDTAKLGYEEPEVRSGGNVFWLRTSKVPLHDDKGRVMGILGTYEDITEQKKAEAELRAAMERLGSSLESTINAIAMMSELRDPYTAGHQRRVTHLALAIAAELGLPDDRTQALRVAGLLHDVGKTYVPSEILSKPGRLTDLEMGMARMHATASYDVVSAIKFPWPVASIVNQHHERMDGSGYPAGLKGDEISLEARIIAVADVTEAMMSHRPYRPALGMDKALAEITSNRGGLYDENAVDACIKLLTEKGFTFPD